MTNASVLTSVEEHVTDHSRAPVNFERVSTQHDSLQNHSPRIAAQKSTCGHQVLHTCGKGKTKKLNHMLYW